MNNNTLDNEIMTDVVRCEWSFTGFCRNCDNGVTEETSEYYWNALRTYIENAWHEHLPSVKLIGSIHFRSLHQHNTQRQRIEP